MKQIVVVGGGASGLIAAYAAGKRGNSVLLIEKNEKLGKKIYITGKGRCNVTNDCSPDDFLQNVVHGEKFLTGSVYSFPPAKLMELLEEYGLSLKTERGNRVFPMSDRASDVTKALERACRAVGVEIHLNEKCIQINCNGERVKSLVTDKKEYVCDAVLVCTGGLSYPSTGSTGDGYRFAKEVGHKIIPCIPSLVGLNCKGNWSDVQGISLKNVVLTAKHHEKTIFSQLGELLFTHFGISGPLVLSLSAEINRLPVKDIALSLDLKPALDLEKLDARLIRDLSERKNEQMKNIMRGLLPAKLVFPVLERACVSAEKQGNALKKEERLRLAQTLKNFAITPASLRDFSEAVVTSGGIDLKEINPKTMESKKMKGLFFCGEVLDIDAYTGGFNLQIAFSSGYSAGNSQ